MWNPRPSSAALLGVVVNGCRRAPASASAVVAGVAVEPDVERIRGVGGSEARPSKRERRAFAQCTKEGVLRNPTGANGGRCRALPNRWALLIG